MANVKRSLAIVAAIAAAAWTMPGVGNVRAARADAHSRVLCRGRCEAEALMTSARTRRNP